MANILIGATGLLGRHLVLNNDTFNPSHLELDITNPFSVTSYFTDLFAKKISIDNVILCAAYTDVASSNNNKQLAYNTNVKGPQHIVHILNELFRFKVGKPSFVYISTDYVFKGDRGNYSINDPLDPVPDNYYAMTKAMGEVIISSYSPHKIIRTSFCRSDTWPYPIAFTDQFTSRDFIEVIAPMISKAINWGQKNIYHIGTETKSVYDLAKRINPNVRPGSRLDIKSVHIPFNTSLELTC